MKRKIYLITTNRADYGLQRNVIFLLKKNKKINFKLIVAGSHHDKEYGSTITEILADKNKINFSLKNKIKKSNSLSTLLSMSESLKKFAKIFSKGKPDIVVILGDRYEMLMASISATINRIPIAHIQGGETTEGAFDDTVRHVITKMSSLHFVAHEKYKKILLKFGESKKNIFNFGGLGAENIKLAKFIDKKKIEEKFRFKFKKKNILVVFHPVTREPNTTKKYFNNIISALEKFPEIQFIFTYPNPDPENNIIIKILKKAQKRNKNFVIIKSFGQNNFFSVLKIVDGILGNSSSGILEMPTFKKGTINIGNRQKGRIQVKSVINSYTQSQSIEKSIKYLYSKSFEKKKRLSKNLYFKKNTSRNIVNTLTNFPLKNLIKKSYEFSKITRI